MVGRTILINPNFQDDISDLSQISIGPPLGLAYIAAILKKKGFCVNIIDANAEKLDRKEILSILKKENPKYVGITATTPTYASCLKLAKQIKKTLKTVKIVFGGIHPSTFPNEVLKEKYIDYVVLNEGEYTFLELIEGKKLLKNIQGLGFKDKGIIKINPKREFIKNLDDLPFPARELLPNDKYASLEFSSFSTIIAMRGCPANCIYCSVPKFCGRTLRIRSVKNVIEEIEELVYKFKIKSFSFLDDTFTYDKKWVESFCLNMIDKRLNDKIKWLCLTRVDTVDLALLKLMKKAGCYKIELGIESGSPKILKKIGKGITRSQIKNAFRLAKKARLATMAFVMVGFPFEKKEDILMTKKLLHEINPNFIQVSYPTPYPNTPFYEYCKKKNVIENVEKLDFSRYKFLKELNVKNKQGLSKERIISLKKDIEKSFYIRPIYMIRNFFYILKISKDIKLVMRRILSFMGKI
ncbi:hypothetical protein C0585_01275 [Candidatus Woesearchaeota archaeon]|nr:MAG: hypothetical protein C0585_01275 [Candidatus Woesearchaeota archaeon]